nr:adenosine deaminase [Paenibacillus timonensis]
MSLSFTEALHLNALDELKRIPKSDLHSHAGRGGNISYIETWSGAKIEPPGRPFDSLLDMQAWFESNIKIHCRGLQGYLKRIEASFAQAQADRIEVLALSFGLDEISTLGGMKTFMGIIEELHRCLAPGTSFFPELSLGRESRIEDILKEIDEVLAYRWFASIDICNDEFAQPIRHFKPVYRIAKVAGLKLRAHVGEFGSPDDVREAVEELELDEVHHGIAAARSVSVMNWLADHHIRLNVCPTSNILLRVADSYARHPLRKLYDYGVPVTINTDDLLIFNQSVSQEYLNLYQSGLMTAEELDLIRVTGLSYVGSLHKHH